MPDDDDEATTIVVQTFFLASTFLFFPSRRLSTDAPPPQPPLETTDPATHNLTTKPSIHLGPPCITDPEPWGTWDPLGFLGGGGV